MAEKYQRKIKLATWVDSSTHCAFARNDIVGGGSGYPHRLYSKRSGTAAFEFCINDYISSGDETEFITENFFYIR